MASNGCSEELLRRSCDALTNVIDNFRLHTPAQRQSQCAQIIRDARTLFESLESLEKEARFSNYQFYGAGRCIRNCIGDVVNECGQLAKILVERINDNTLRDELWVGKDIPPLIDEVNWIVGTLKGRRQTLETGDIRDLRRRLEDTVSKLEAAQVEVVQLRSLCDSHPNPPAPDFHPPPTVPEPDSLPKLAHIKSLHVAISNLGLLHHRRHGLDTWSELSGELRTMLDVLHDANLHLLERVENPSALPSISSPTLGHNRTRSEPSATPSSSMLSRGTVNSGPPSAGSSNASRPRDSTSTSGNGSQSRAKNRRSNGRLLFPVQPRC